MITNEPKRQEKKLRLKLNYEHTYKLCTKHTTITITNMTAVSKSEVILDQLDMEINLVK